MSLAVSMRRAHRPERNLNICRVLACMEYVTDRDFPNHYPDGVNVRLCDTRDNTFSSSKEQFKEPCTSEKLLLIKATLILTPCSYNLQDFLFFIFFVLSVNQGSNSHFTRPTLTGLRITQRLMLICEELLNPWSPKSYATILLFIQHKINSPSVFVFLLESIFSLLLDVLSKPNKQNVPWLVPITSLVDKIPTVPC